MRDECFIAEVLGPRAGPCDGYLQKMHLIPQRFLKRELRHVVRGSHLRDVIWRPALWRPACEKHHHALDYSRKVRLLREHIPGETEECAVDLDGLLERAGRRPRIVRYLDREYGELVHAES